MAPRFCRNSLLESRKPPGILTSRRCVRAGAELSSALRASGALAQPGNSSESRLHPALAVRRKGPRTADAAVEFPASPPSPNSFPTPVPKLISKAFLSGWVPHSFLSTFGFSPPELADADAHVGAPPAATLASIQAALLA